MPPASTQEGFYRWLAELKDSYGLEIFRRDVALSPTKRRERHAQLSESQQRVEVIYSRLHRLYFQDSELLATAMAEFRRKASRAPAPHSSMGRAALEESLLACLSAEPRRVKRVSPEASQGPIKRSRTYEVGSPVRNIDSIPVRSSQSQTVQPPSTWAAAPNRPSFTESTNTSFTSVASSNRYDGIETAQTSFRSSTSDLPATTFAQRLREPPRIRENNAPQAGASVIIDLTSNDESDQPRPPSPAKPPSPPKLELEDRLKHIWPRMKVDGLNGAPLPVIWETTRVSLECNANLNGSELKYPAPEWEQQKTMWSQFKGLDRLKGQSLPTPTDEKIWDAALHYKEISNRCAAYSIDLEFNKGDADPLFSVRLQPIKLELGHRLSRKFGSDRFLEVTIPQLGKSDKLPKCIRSDKHAHEKLVAWLTRKPHSILGRFWMAYFVREGKKMERKAKDSWNIDGDEKETKFFHQVCFFACDGDSFRCNRSLTIPNESETRGKRIKVSLEELFRWAVNWTENKSQHPLKLFSRMQLSLSRTQPTVVLEKHQILFRDDIGTHEVMNDGAGRMSPSLARKIAEKLGLPQEDCPCAFQARLGSAKGMWVIDISDTSEEDWIEIYPSQNKWECDFEDVHHRTFEVKDYPRGIKSAGLNQQFIPMLEAQSTNPLAMRRVLEKHLRASLIADLDSNMSAMDDPAEFRLWLQRYRSSGDERLQYVQFQGSLPARDEDTLALLCDAGFEPKKLEFMQKKIRQLKEQRCKELRDRLNFTIPCSAFMFMIPDFWSILEEGEVHVSFSSQFQVEGFSDTLLEGREIIVARAPAHFPSDMQKVKVVSREGLRLLKDVVIFSTKGESSLADKLSGGDYDGDRAWVCWDSDVVHLFNSAEVPKKPDLFEEGFLEKSSLAFGEHGGGVSTCADLVYQGFLFNMQPSLLGICTTFKEAYCFRYDTISNEKAIALSTLLSLLVDQAKQGTIFTEDNWKKFRISLVGDNYNKIRKPDFSSKAPVITRKGGKVHILEHFQLNVVNVVIDEAMQKFNEAVKPSNLQEGAILLDPQLTKLERDYDEYAYGVNGDVIKSLLRHLRDEIDKIVDAWLGEVRRSFSSKILKYHEQWMAIQPPSELMSHPIVESLMDSWCDHQQYSKWSLLKASVTFKKFYKSNTEIAWRLAGSQLAYIKARATKTPSGTADVMVKATMWAALRPDKRVIERRMRRRVADSDATAALDEVMNFDDDGSVLDDT